MEIPSYPKVWAVGHAAIPEMFLDPVLVQEKIDGSQFSFALFDKRLFLRSKGAEVFTDNPGMFKLAVASVLERAECLVPGWVYRAEFLMKPKHNALAYNRVPAGNLILFDIEDLNKGPGHFLAPDVVAMEAEHLNLECVPNFGTIDFNNLPPGPEAIDVFMDLLKRPSCLGGPQPEAIDVFIEGVVCKNYQRFGRDGKVLMAKYVSEAYKESHKLSWRAGNPTKADVVEEIIAALATPARWEKAVHHLRDLGLLEGDPRDIGKLMIAVQEDVNTEEEENIKAALFKWAWPQIKRHVASGVPQWYKDRLAAAAFADIDHLGCKTPEEAV